MSQVSADLLLWAIGSVAVALWGECGSLCRTPLTGRVRLRPGEVYKAAVSLSTAAGSLARINVPCPGAEASDSTPPSASTRKRMPTSP